MVGKNLRETDAGKNRHSPGLLLGRPNFVRWVLVPGAWLLLHAREF